MAIRSRMTQDRRSISRVITRLDCEFSYQGISHEAVIVDLSFNGAFLSSKFLPPTNSLIAVTLKTPLLNKPLTLEGKVLRGGSGFSEHGRVDRFGIKFGDTSLDIVQLIGKLIAKQGAV